MYIHTYAVEPQHGPQTLTKSIDQCIYLHMHIHVYVCVCVRLCMYTHVNTYTLELNMTTNIEEANRQIVSLQQQLQQDTNTSTYS